MGTVICLTNELICRAVDEYSTLLFRISFFHVKSKEDAEDIVQETFLALHGKKPKIFGEEHLKAWLIKAAVNKSKNQLKSAIRKRNVPLDEAVIAKYDLDSTNIDVLESIARLKPIDRNIIFLYYYEGFSAKETGDIIGKKEDAVFTRLKRAREKLKFFLEE